MEKSIYKPVSCSFYDLIESFAVKKETVEIVYSDQTQKKMVAVIVDVFSKNSIEFLKLNSGEMIRLDSILTINGIPQNNFC